MSMEKYFMSQDDLDRKSGQMLREVKTLEDRLRKLTSELRQHAASWKEMSRLCSSSPSWSF